MNVNRLIIKGKREGEQIYLIGFEGDPGQGFVANLEHDLRWYPHSIHSIFGNSCGWEPYDSPRDREILERVARLKGAGE
jgi:hypothetical protein